MKIILLQDVKKVGKKNQTVDVKDGYGNFLINSGKAIMSSDKAHEIVTKQVAQEKKEYDQSVAQATSLKAKIEAVVLTFSLKTNKGQAFGSISNKQVLEQLQEKTGIKLDKFMLVEGNKTYGLGQSRIAVKLHKEVTAYLTIKVTGE